MLRSAGRLLAITLLEYATNVREPEPYEKLLGDAEVVKDELKLARALIVATRMDDPELERYHDQYNERLKDLVNAKIDGREVVEAKSTPSPPMINYMDAIRASLQKRAKSATTRRKPTRAPAKRRKTGYSHGGSGASVRDTTVTGPPWDVKRFVAQSAN
jgi:DNA end-binding protein Ku